MHKIKHWNISKRNKLKMHGHCTLKLITDKHFYLDKKNTTLPVAYACL